MLSTALAVLALPPGARVAASEDLDALRQQFLGRAGLSGLQAQLYPSPAPFSRDNPPPARLEDVLDESTASSSPPPTSSSPQEQVEHGACDASWCNCAACSRPRIEGACDLCRHRWIFIVATGRSGSTSILEGLNALPGVSLSGENYALLNNARDMFLKTSQLSSKGGAAFEASADGVEESTHCAMQELFAKIAGGNLSETGPRRYLGFKELVSLPSLRRFINGRQPTEHFVSWSSEWLDYLDALFPCARIVFNIRRDVTAQARAIYSTFDGGSNLPLTEIEQEMATVSEQILAWHAQRSRRASGGKARSFLLYTEDFTPQRFSELGQWLGFPCTFHAVPRANDPNAVGAPLDEKSAQAAAAAAAAAALAASNGTNGTALAAAAAVPVLPAKKAGWSSGFFHKDYAAINLTCAGPAEAAQLRRDFTRRDFEPAPTVKEVQLVDGFDASLAHDEQGEECEAAETLPNNLVCVPPPGEIDSFLEAEASSAKRDEDGLNVTELPRFFIHEEGVFNFTRELKCYYRAIRGRYLVDDLDSRLFPDISEHLADMFLLERLRRHPARVHSADEAHLHVIGSPLVAAFRAHRGEKWDPTWKSSSQGGTMGGPFGCGTISHFYQRVDDIATHLNNSYYWQRRGGKDWLLLNSYYWVKDILGEGLLQMMSRAPSIFTTSDRKYKHFLELKMDAGVDNVTVVPYKANHMLDDFAWVDVAYGTEELTTPRPYSIMFHGSTERGVQTAKQVDATNRVNLNYTEGQLRGLLCDYIEPAIENTTLKCVAKWRHASAARAARSRSATALLAGAAPLGALGAAATHLSWLAPTGRIADPTTTRNYHKSALCLIPAGDTPTSRRLFDAMAGGCIPVLMTPTEDIAPNLPFPSSIDWKSVALFAGGLGCTMQQHPQETVAWLAELLKPEHARAIGCMRRRARAAYRKHLSYRGHGVASALLYQLQNDVRYAPMLNGAVAPVDMESAATSCALETQCGCKGSNRTTFFIRYHQTGSMLTGRLLREMGIVCDIASSRLHEGLDEAQSSDARCHNLKLALDATNLAAFPRERLRRLAAPRRNARFVHLVREPLSLVAAYYASHMQRPLRDERSDVYRALKANLSGASLDDGVRMVAELALREQLPAMAYLHQQFRQQDGTPRSDVLEIRREDLTPAAARITGVDWRSGPRHDRTFDDATSRLAQHAGVPEPCAQQGTQLHAAFDKHEANDPDADAEGAAGGGLSAAQMAEGALGGALPPLPEALRPEADAFAALLRHPDLLHRLQSFGRALGYDYPAVPAELLRPELRDGASSSSVLAQPQPAAATTIAASATAAATAAASASAATAATPAPAPLARMREADCARLLSRRPDLVVMPAHKLIWCPSADAPTSGAVFELLGAQLNASDLGGVGSAASLFDEYSEYSDLVVGRQAARASGGPGGAGGAARPTVGFRLSSQLHLLEVQQLCSGAGAASFTVVSDPWQRLAGVYMTKVLGGDFDGYATVDVRRSVRAMRKFHGMPERGPARVSFAQFVRWLGVQRNAGDLSVHWMPEAVRCDPEHVPYSMVGRQETLADDLHALAAALGWRDATTTTLPRGHEATLLSRATLAACAERAVCATAMAEQAGADWRVLPAAELVQRLYASAPLAELPRRVGSLYDADATPFGYVFAKPGANKTRAEIK